MSRVFYLGCSWILLATLVFADDEPKTDNEAEKRIAQQLQKVNQKSAEEYVMTKQGDEEPLELTVEPVFNWVNAARVGNPRVQNGAVYVWTRSGRAEVVGTIFYVHRQGENASFYHEFHSLATVPLKATVKRSVKWNTPQAGVIFTSFPDAPAPADSPARRMVEMRAFARKFTGYSMNYDDKRWELNLLPQPLYRMPKPTDEVLDQAVFALISTAGTDPEVLVVIEARQGKKAYEWQYSICRFTDLKTFVSYGDQEVWTFANGTNGPTTDAGMNSRYRFINAGNVFVNE